MKLRLPESLTERACRLIRTEILEGRIDSTHRLTEDYFAKQFGISKSPIREALNRLEAEGLIRIAPRRGAFVIDLDRRDIDEIYELREILEAAVVRHIELDSKTAEKLDHAVHGAEKALRKNDKRTYMRDDLAFHIVLARASGNSRLQKALQTIQHQMIILRHRTYELSSHEAVCQHGEILKALKAGDNKLAERLMVEHIHMVRERLLNYVDAKTAESRKAAAAVARNGGGK